MLTYGFGVSDGFSKALRLIRVALAVQDGLMRGLHENQNRKYKSHTANTRNHKPLFRLHLNPE